MLRWITAGESHGPELVAVLEGLPAGVPITTSDVADALARRRLGYGRGARMKFEQDEVSLSGGVRHGFTMGGPVAITVANTEWPKWQDVMSADPVDESKLSGTVLSSDCRITIQLVQYSSYENLSDERSRAAASSRTPRSRSLTRRSRSA